MLFLNKFASMRSPGKSNIPKSRLNLYHAYYKRKGFYQFAYSKGIKAALLFIIILVLLWLAQKFIIDTDYIFASVIDNIPNWQVIVFFFFSEVGFGLIPPDFFIVWSQKFPSPLLMITYLALISYFASFISYYLGRLLRRIPRIKLFLNSKLNKHVLKIRKWGGVLIMFTALFPLPFSLFNVVAGMIKYPFNQFWIFALARIPRFYIYAFFLYKIFPLTGSV